MQPLDLWIPCANSACSHQSFALADLNQDIRCPFCGTPYPISTLPVLKLRSERQPGIWLPDGYFAALNHQQLFLWHIFDNISPDERADQTLQAYCVFNQGRWLLINQALDSLTVPNGSRIPIGSKIELQDKMRFRFSQRPHGRIAEVQILHTSAKVQIPPSRTTVSPPHKENEEAPVLLRSDQLPGQPYPLPTGNHAPNVSKPAPLLTDDRPRLSTSTDEVFFRRITIITAILIAIGSIGKFLLDLLLFLFR